MFPLNVLFRLLEEFVKPFSLALRGAEERALNGRFDRARETARLVQLYEAIEKKDEAAKWHAEWDAAKKFAETGPVQP